MSLREPYHLNLTPRVVEDRLWGDAPLFLLDVGASGGIDERWFVFGQYLRAIGFDPLVNEVDRLNQLTTHQGVRYEAAFIGARDFDTLFPPALRKDRIATKNNDSWLRTSAAAAQQQLQQSYVQLQFNSGAPMVLAESHLTLDDTVPERERAAVDFLKIDTDGHDIEVLLGAEEILNAGGVLGMSIEMQHHGAVHGYANTFDNIDRFMRAHGFTLFDLETLHYSRAALPAVFALDLAAQTMSGQVTASEGVYFRDLGDLVYEQKWAYAISPERVLKLACLLELFGQPDSAAELLLNRGQFLAPSVKTDLLDALASKRGRYAALVRKFEKDFTAFYPSRYPGANSPAPSEAIADPDAKKEEDPQLVELRDRLAALTEECESLRTRVRSQDEQLEKLSGRVEELREPENGEK